MALLHETCVWMQVRKIKRKSLINARFWLVKNQVAFDFSDVGSNTNFMQRGQYMSQVQSKIWKKLHSLNIAFLQDFEIWRALKYKWK